MLPPTMEISKISLKRRYLLSPCSFYPLLFTAQSGYYTLSYKTLNSVRNHHINGKMKFLCKSPNSNPLLNLVCSIGLASVSSAISSSSKSPNSRVIFGNNNRSVAHRIFVCTIAYVRPFSSDSCSSSSSEKHDFVMPGMCFSHRSQSRTRRRKITVQKQNVKPQKIVEIIELIQREESDLASKLNQINVSLSLSSFIEIIRALNCKRVSALRFFYLIRDMHPEFYRNSEICSLLINNVGHLDDFESMLLLLQDFKSKKVSLTEKAFGFLSDCSSNGTSVKETIRRVIEILNKAGGSCRNSGIHALVNFLCIGKAFDLAFFVMEETERKTSYYNVLIQAKCRDHDIQDPQVFIDEMKRFGCDPNANTYNYLLGSLCKNERIPEACKLLEVMQESGQALDAITFEILICYSCRLGRLDFATDFLHKMTSRGLEPRLTTHAAFVKGYFYSGQYQEAYKYVIGMDVNYKCSLNTCYSLLASLHWREGNVLLARDVKEGVVVDPRDILIQMLERGLKPNFPVYIKVLKNLYKSGNQQLATDLKSRFSKFL